MQRLSSCGRDCLSSSRVAHAIIAAQSPASMMSKSPTCRLPKSPTQLAAGAVHLGVTGEDLVREMIPDADKRVVLIEGLGFGFANVVVAVPQAWIDVRTMADVDDVATAFRHHHDRKMRVATKYINLTRDFFSAHGVIDYRIVESSGATEGAPAAGTAEMIVDITTSGATLAANGLKVVEDGTILRSQANLVAARNAAWGKNERDLARVILDRVAAQARARAFREVRARFAAGTDMLVENARQKFAIEAPFGGPSSSGMLILHCPPDQVYALTNYLRENGAEAVAVADLDYVFSRDNPLYTKLEAGLLERREIDRFMPIERTPRRRQRVFQPAGAVEKHHLIGGVPRARQQGSVCRQHKLPRLPGREGNLPRAPSRRALR